MTASPVLRGPGPERHWSSANDDERSADQIITDIFGLPPSKQECALITRGALLEGRILGYGRHCEQKCISGSDDILGFLLDPVITRVSASFCSRTFCKSSTPLILQQGKCLDFDDSRLIPERFESFATALLNCIFCSDATQAPSSTSRKPSSAWRSSSPELSTRSRREELRQPHTVAQPAPRTHERARVTRCIANATRAGSPRSQGAIIALPALPAEHCWRTVSEAGSLPRSMVCCGV